MFTVTFEHNAENPQQPNKVQDVVTTSMMPNYQGHEVTPATDPSKRATAQRTKSFTKLLDCNSTLSARYENGLPIYYLPREVLTKLKLITRLRHFIENIEAELRFTQDFFESHHCLGVVQNRFIVCPFLIGPKLAYDKSHCASMKDWGWSESEIRFVADRSHNKLQCELASEQDEQLRMAGALTASSAFRKELELLKSDWSRLPEQSRRFPLQRRMYLNGDDLNDMTTLGFSQQLEHFLNKWRLAKLETFELPYPLGTCRVEDVESLKDVLPVGSAYIHINDLSPSISRKQVDNAWNDSGKRATDRVRLIIREHAKEERYATYFKYVLMCHAMQSRLADSEVAKLTKTAMINVVASWLGMDARNLWSILQKVDAASAD